MSDKKWDDRFMALAGHVASWSKDPRTKVGSVIVRPDKTVASLGFNGFPRGIEDSEERLNDRPTKNALVCHAEANAILAAGEKLHGSTLYVTPLSPCMDCAKLIIQSGVKRVVMPPIDETSAWRASCEAARDMLVEAGLDVSVSDGGKHAE